MENTKWILDQAHSELFFKVKHLMITNVRGEFQNFDIAVEANGDDFDNAKVSATADVESIFTKQKDRDSHLKSEDFFDAANHPQLKFDSSSVVKLDAHNYKLSGDLTIRGAVKEVVLDVEFGGVVHDPVSGHTKAGFTISGKINRGDWGLTYNAALESGGVLLSDEVRITAEIQLIKEEAEKAA